MARSLALALAVALGSCSWFHPPSVADSRAAYLNCMKTTTVGAWACETYRQDYNIRAANEGLPAIPPPPDASPAQGFPKGAM